MSSVALYSQMQTRTSLAEALDQDRRFMIGHASLKMAQAASITLLPMSYCISVFLRQEIFDRRQFLRLSGRCCFLIIAPLGAAFATVRVWAQPGWFVRDRALSLRSIPSQARVDRFSLVGAALGGSALAFSSVACNGPLMHRTMGGACLGLATGVFAHLITSSFHERFTWHHPIK